MIKTSAKSLILGVSLAFNIAIIGIISGSAVKGHHITTTERGTRAAQSPRDIGFSPFMATLDSSSRQEIGQSFRNKIGSRQETRARMNETFQNALPLLTDQNFDAEAFEKALIGIHTEMQRAQIAGIEGLVGLIAQMSYEERIQYSEKVQEFIETKANMPPPKKKKED